MRYKYGELVIDTTRMVVERSGEHVSVQPQVLDVLCYLITHQDRMVPKEELLDEIWGDRFVGDSSLSSRIKAVRRLVGDDGTAQRAIKTLHGRGYRWVADLVPVDDAADGGSQTERATTTHAEAHTILPPRSLTRLVGRAAEVDEVESALRTRRLVTIVGPPGVGKSRLAVEATAAEVELGTREVAFVDLRPIMDLFQVVTAIHRSVSVEDGTGSLQAARPEDSDSAITALIDRLRNRQLVLILDNCEHVVAEIADVGSQILQSCSLVSILATSRRSLGLEGEMVSVLHPLTVASRVVDSWADLESIDAGLLFLERSVAAGARWEESPTEARLINAVCRRLDGIPLAIELAAAGTRWLALDDMLRQLDDAFDLPATAGRSEDPLQIALRSSRALLLEQERQAFDALSVFAASFTLDAALSVIGAVCPNFDPVAIFGALVDHSLVDVINGDPRRYRLLETIQRYAESCRIGSLEADAAVAAHYEHYLQFVEQRWPAGLISTDHPWSELAVEKIEIEAAVRRIGEVDQPAARQLLGALGWYWWLGGDAHHWYRLAEEFVGTADDDPSEIAATFYFGRMLAVVLLGRDPAELAEQAYKTGVDCGRWSLAAWSLAFSAAPNTLWIDLQPVADHWPEIVTLFERAKDDCGEAWAMVLVLGFAEACADRSDDAVSTYERAAAQLERCGDAMGRARALIEIVELDIWIRHDVARARYVYDSIPRVVLPLDSRAKRLLLGGIIAAEEGDHETAVSLQSQAVEICEEHLPSSLLTNTYRCIAALELTRAQQLPLACQLLFTTVESLRGLRTHPGWNRHCPWVLESAASILIDAGRVEAAAKLVGSAEQIRIELDAPMPFWDEPSHRPTIEKLQTQLDDVQFGVLLDEGRALGAAGAGKLAQTTLSAWLRDIGAAEL